MAFWMITHRQSYFLSSQTIIIEITIIISTTARRRLQNMGNKNK